MLVPRYRPPRLRVRDLVTPGSLGELERVASSLIGVPSRAIGSARAGIVAALRVRVPRGATVLVPELTAPCVPSVIERAGYRVRPVAICPRRWVLTDETLAAAITPDCRAVIATHLEGALAPMCAIAAVARRNDLVVIEDAAHALGAPIGVHSDVVVCSFGRGKHLGLPAGGVIASRDHAMLDAIGPELGASPSIAPRLGLHALLRAATGPRVLSCLGPVLRIALAADVDLPSTLLETAPDQRAPARFPSALVGAAIDGLTAMPRVTDRRRERAVRLRAGLRELGIDHQHAASNDDHPLWVAIRADDRRRLQRRLLAAGIDAQPTFMRALRGASPLARAIEREALYLPWEVPIEPLLAALTEP